MPGFDLQPVYVILRVPFQQADCLYLICYDTATAHNSSNVHYNVKPFVWLALAILVIQMHMHRAETLSLLVKAALRA